ncbi:MAG: TlpA family protein disulfide reductase [Pseudomonas sp.]|uniref:TlpA disulfide reductase family protein n=1 Tax=Ectopseudomonas guguanensis TaxID=1198456 RepID=UPI0012D7013C|nr:MULTISPECIES: TlpA disulfide reductase family protein [Pseudomonas]MPT20073.1 TlpA family protein disulfide reductase [Pseudomonas sp.]WJH58712.1 TlpA family protein disulfide reductase [Pseudomonas guguanensis]
MLTLNLGPLALGVTHVLLFGSLLLATLVGWLIGRRHGCNPESQLFRMLMVGLLVARVAFVLVYAEYYRDEPWRVVDIRDGGFIAWPGVLAGLALGVWYLWRQATLRRPLGVAMGVGLALWLGGNLTLQALEQGTRLPDLQVRNLQGEAVNLRDYAGRPLVVNLWATWCPPCRREMPVLMQAQQRETGITILFVNQGESAALVTEFLAAQQLSLDHLLLDEPVRLGQLVGSRALPTTLFYDAEGRQVGSHLGELSHASLERALARLRGD